MQRMDDIVMCWWVWVGTGVRDLEVVITELPSLETPGAK